MAYNRGYSNPDELPRFAEPEPKGKGAKAQAPAPAPAPNPASRYENKPPPPRPLEHRGSSDRYQPSPQDRYQQPPPDRHQQPAHDRYHQAPPDRYQQPPPDRYQQPPSDRYQQTPQDRYQQDRLSPRLSPRPNDRFAMSPPPNHRGQPSPRSQPPPSPGPDNRGDKRDMSLMPLFNAVDKDETGQLSESELAAALVNGDWTPFDPETVRMMIRMFDSDRSGTIGFDEFCGLWSFLASWRELFDRFDVDKSGTITLDEFTKALIAFRYRLTPGFVGVLFRTYDKRRNGEMSFDLFVQACISLKRMTDVFKKYDEDRDGFITLSFESFLTEILRQTR
ncbi:hypothetical protein B0H63DRAFT_51073 [Podospora didyma]|uniref:EF-hand domain-containing protein n=1 Tax=Podospora didyma TaxID=330526 RepID=A0AAE0U876_9PEZI|nr:hypothetical protein B0H63DRAFT_51073 [Podospora didyma]